MTVRIKRHWFEDGRERSPEEKASVVAVAVWFCSALASIPARRRPSSTASGATFWAISSAKPGSPTWRSAAP